MHRLAIEPVPIRQLDYPAEVHDRDAVGDMSNHSQIMADKQVGEAQPALQLLKQIDDLRLDRNVQRGDGLVANDQLRVQRKRAGNADALPLSAREFVRIPVGVAFAEPDRLHELANPLEPLRCGHRQVLDERLGNDRLHSHPRIETRLRVLEDHLHARTHPPDLARLRVGELHAIECDLSFRDAAQLKDGAAGGCLSAARLADQTERFSAHHVD